MSQTTEVIVGRVGRAHGLRGEVAIDVRTDEPARRFVVGSRLRRGSGGTLTLATTTWNRGKLLVTFEGYPDRTAVETLRGEELLLDVPVDETPSEPGEYFDRQLVGLGVLDHDGIGVGEVVAVAHLPAQDVLEIRLCSGEERMVPFVRALVPTVDLAAGHLRLAPVPGLLEDLE